MGKRASSSGSAAAGRRRDGRSRGRGHDWESLPKGELLDVRLSRLGLRIEGTPLERRVERLHAEFEAAGFRFRPHVWLSTDWFTPDGVPGFAVPFFLAHPRLVQLERSMMYEVEGGDQEGCMRLMRHEAAHALDNAFRLRRRKRFREVFGSPGRPYRPSYVPKPGSRDFVINLDNWYAQSHPVEDFAETFAVWLRPRSQWRRRYEGWPALAKLEYVDGLAREIAGRRPLVRSRERVDSLPQLKMTLRQFYRAKMALYGEEDRSIYDRDLRRLFSDDTADRGRMRASTFLRARRQELRRQVATWTGQYQFVVDQVLRDMMIRARQLGLRLRGSEREAREGAVVLLTAYTTEFTRRRHREFFR